MNKKKNNTRAAAATRKRWQRYVDKKRSSNTLKEQQSNHDDGEYTHTHIHIQRKREKVYATVTLDHTQESEREHEDEEREREWASESASNTNGIGMSDKEQLRLGTHTNTNIHNNTLEATHTNKYNIRRAAAQRSWDYIELAQTKSSLAYTAWCIAEQPRRIAVRKTDGRTVGQSRRVEPPLGQRAPPIRRRGGARRSIWRTGQYVSFAVLVLSKMNLYVRNVAAFKILKTFLKKQNKKPKTKENQSKSRLVHTHCYSSSRLFLVSFFFFTNTSFSSFFFYSLLFCCSLDICRALRISIKTFLPLPSF